MSTFTKVRMAPHDTPGLRCPVCGNTGIVAIRNSSTKYFCSNDECRMILLWQPTNFTSCVSSREPGVEFYQTTKTTFQWVSTNRAFRGKRAFHRRYGQRPLWGGFVQEI